MKRFKLTVILSINVILSYAQDTTKLQPLEVLGIKAYNKMPITKTDLNKKDISGDYYGNDIPVLLSKTPNITYYSDGGNYSGYMYYRIRGIDQTRINSTLDGVPLNEPEDQGAFFSNYPDFSSNVSFIQIQRGVGISSNGTSSYAGSLNFESPNLLDSSYRSIDATFGSFNSKLYGATINTGLRNNFAMYARFSKINSDGYRDHSGTNGSTFFFSGGYYKNKTEIKFTSFFGKSENQQAYLAADEDILAINRKYNAITPQETDNFFQNLNSIQYKYTINNHLKFGTSIYYNKLIGTYKVLIDSSMSNFGLNSNFYGWITNLNYQSKEFNISFGTHLNSYNRQHLTTYDLGQVQYENTGYKNEQSEFLKALYTNKRWTIYSDVQLRNVFYQYKKQLNYQLILPTKNWLFLNWRGGINYEIQPNLFIYSFIGHSYKEPTRTALLGAYDDIDSTNVNEVGNFNKVKPESVLDFEFGINYVDQQKSLKVNFYNMSFVNEIDPIGQLNFIGQPLSKNVNHSKRIGLELDGWYKITRNTKLMGNVTANDANINEYTTDYDGKSYHDRFPLLTPRFLLNVSIEQNIIKGLSITLSEKYISQSWLDNENTKVLPAYIQTNTFINYEIKQTKVLMGMNNIFNRNNYNAGYIDGTQRAFYVAPTRNIYIGLKQNF